MTKAENSNSTIKSFKEPQTVSMHRPQFYIIEGLLVAIVVLLLFILKRLPSE